MMRLIGWDGVLRQRALTPGVCTTYAMNGSIDIKIDETGTRDVVRMTSTFKVFLTVVPSPDAERTITSFIILTFEDKTEVDLFNADNP